MSLYSSFDEYKLYKKQCASQILTVRVLAKPRCRSSDPYQTISAPQIFAGDVEASFPLGIDGVMSFETLAPRLLN